LNFQAVTSTLIQLKINLLTHDLFFPFVSRHVMMRYILCKMAQNVLSERWEIKKNNILHRTADNTLISLSQFMLFLTLRLLLTLKYGCDDLDFMMLNKLGPKSAIFKQVYRDLIACFSYLYQIAFTPSGHFNIRSYCFLVFEVSLFLKAMGVHAFIKWQLNFSIFVSILLLLRGVRASDEIYLFIKCTSRLCFTSHLILCQLQFNL